MWSNSYSSYGVLRLDNPWHRLPWVLPTAFLIWVIILWLAGIYMERMAQRLPEPKPIEARLIELPQAPPPEVQAAEPELPKEPEPIKKKIIAKPKTPQPVIERNPSPPETPPPQPSVQTEPPPPAPQEPTKPALVVQPSTVINGGNLGARAIFQPKPQIPDELRVEALNAIAIARFHVAADGTATVELIKPTNNPRLNQILLNTLKNWRFFPALASGKPVASTQDLRIHLEID